MIRKKNGFFVFCCSLIPGAGEMYMGFMKRGISLMSLFFLLIFLATWLRFDTLLFAIPIIWFYGFFHTHNLRSMPEEEFYAMEDTYIDFPGFFHSKKLLQQKYHKIFAITLILIGVSILWNNMWNLLWQVIPDMYYYEISRILDSIPQIIIGIAIIVLGVYLIRGKNRELNETLEGLPVNHEGSDSND